MFVLKRDQPQTDASDLLIKILHEGISDAHICTPMLRGVSKKRQLRRKMTMRQQTRTAGAHIGSTRRNAFDNSPLVLDN
jgi:hypothetical protein